MSDTISRQGAIDAFGLSEKTRKYGGDHSGYNTMMLYEIQDVLESLPSASDSRQRGEWIFEPKDAIELMFTKPKCSECGFESADGGNFCSNCGAKMYKGGAE